MSERGESYEYANFIPALYRLGHEVAFFESWDRNCASSFIDLNTRLLQTVEQVRPDIILSVQRLYEIWHETWSILKDMKIAATINWTTDDSWRYDQFSKFIAPVFHAFTTTYPRIFDRYKQDCLDNVILTQWGASSEKLKKPLRSKDCSIEVSFVGSAHGNRRTWIKALHKRGVNVKCYGYGWDSGAVESSKVYDIYRQSKISLNFVDGSLVLDGLTLKREGQIKARTFEVPGAGGFVLTENVDGLEKYFTMGEELDSFQTVEEATEKIQFYLNRPEERDRIAVACFERIVKDHTYEQRLQPVLEFALAQRKAYEASNRDFPKHVVLYSEIVELNRRHAIGFGLRALRRILVLVCALFWGKYRGSRAARRFVFEISWRLLGSKTYSASGFPGRMFYMES